MGEEEAPVVWISDGREIYGNALFFLRKRGGLLWLDFAAWAARTYTMNVV